MRATAPHPCTALDPLPEPWGGPAAPRGASLGQVGGPLPLTSAGLWVVQLGPAGDQLPWLVPQRLGGRWLGSEVRPLAFMGFLVYLSLGFLVCTMEMAPALLGRLTAIGAEPATVCPPQGGSRHTAFLEKFGLCYLVLPDGTFWCEWSVKGGNPRGVGRDGVGEGRG